MRKILSILILALFIITLLPVVKASPLTQILIGDDAVGDNTRSIVAYTRYGNYMIYGYILRNGQIKLVVVDSNGQIVMNKDLPVSAKIADDRFTYLDLDANETGILIAYYDTGDDVSLYWVGFDGSERNLGKFARTTDIEEAPVVRVLFTFMLPVLSTTTKTMLYGDAYCPYAYIM